MVKSARVICPVCRREFSYGFLRYGFGHLCKRNAPDVKNYLNKIIKKAI